MINILIKIQKPHTCPSDPLSIDQLITSHRYKTVLGLGNSSILRGKLLNQIIGYLKRGLIYCLSGNKDEFQCLCGKNNTMDYITHEYFKHTPYILTTLGEQGMIASCYEKTYYQDASKCENIVSSSGCGDISLGIFLSGIINKEDPSQILKNAAHYSSVILERQSNMFEEGFENVELH